MDWLQFITFCIANVGLFVWNRTESRTDMRHMDAKLAASLVAMDGKLEAALNAMNANVQCIQAETKDFHGRLCAIEERNRK